MSDEQGEALFEEDELPPAKFMFMRWWQPDGGERRPKWMSFPCPGKQTPSGGRCMVPIFPQKNGNGASWQWNGDQEKPTLTPSINCYGCWHGFITNGEITPDVDGRTS